jgi:hypothetical protein
MAQEGQTSISKKRLCFVVDDGYMVVLSEQVLMSLLYGS